jgi:hypothetical protein
MSPPSGEDAATGEAPRWISPSANAARGERAAEERQRIAGGLHDSPGNRGSPQREICGRPSARWHGSA